LWGMQRLTQIAHAKYYWNLLSGLKEKNKIRREDSHSNTPTRVLDKRFLQISSYLTYILGLFPMFYSMQCQRNPLEAVLCVSIQKLISGSLTEQSGRSSFRETFRELGFSSIYCIFIPCDITSISVWIWYVVYSETRFIELVTATGIKFMRRIVECYKRWDFSRRRMWSSGPMMEAGSTSETSVDLCQTTRRNIPEDSHLYTLRRENLKFHSVNVAEKYFFMLSVIV
jgi:hypothetical protein